MTGFKPGDRVQPAAHCRDTWPASAGTVVGPVSTPVRVVWDNATMITIHPATNLEPLGEPMTKEFASAATSSDRTLVIDSSGDSGILKIMRGDYYIGGINLDPANAPALALAILEAAGIEPVPFDEAPETEAGHAAWVLRHHVQASEEAAKEAADQKELETEALTLCRVMWDNSDQQWAPMSPKAKAMWLVMARTAREMHNR